MIIQRYQEGEEAAWNEFIATSRNGTFLLDRRYMDYHRDRFQDHSLVMKDDSGRIVAAMPANESDGTLNSHAGLTYGGLVLGAAEGSVAVLKMFDCIREYMGASGLSTLRYKAIPWIYHRQPSEEDRYALFRAGAKLSRRDVLSVVPRDNRLKYQGRRSRGVKLAIKTGVEVAESSAYRSFWQILEENLQARYGVTPVHNLGEIELLRGRFPDSIRLFTAQRKSEVIAGVVIYETPMVAHVQYISADEAGKEFHALDALFDHLLADVYRNKPYFDFGISNEEAGMVLNAGLVEHKEGFGARTVVHDYYELET